MGKIHLPEIGLEEALDSGAVAAEHAATADATRNVRQCAARSPSAAAVRLRVDRGRHLRAPARREPTHVRYDVRGHAQ